MGTGASTIKTPTKVHAVNDEAVPASVKMVESSRQKGRQLNTADNAEKHAHSRQTSKERQTRYVSPHNKSANGAKERGAAISDPQFKLFRTHSNQEYTVHIKEDGKMFYVDWEDQKWRVFPTEWINNGTFVTEDLQINFERDGELVHPFRGRLTTLLRQESLNVMYFFDESHKNWLPMPLNWERQTPHISHLISQIKLSCPQWNDDKSIVAALRQCNYNVEDAVSYYTYINDEGAFDKLHKDDDGTGHTDVVNKLQDQIKELKEQLSKYERESCDNKSVIVQLKDQLNESKNENVRLRQELQVIRTEQNKQSAILEKSLNLTSFRGHPISLKLGIIKPLVQSTGQEVRAIKMKLQSTRTQLKRNTKSYNEQILQLSNAMRLMVNQYRQQANEIIEARALYRKEALQRKLLFNEVQELKGNIRVFCRCRQDESGPCALTFEGEDLVHCMNNQGRMKSYEFEKVYRPTSTQDEVFEDTRAIITSCVDGYNVCIIAYGQTGSGKTYTMMGPHDNPGVNIRSIKELFKILQERDKTHFEMKVSMVEVYNECIYDLLTSPDEREKLHIQNKGKNINIQGLTECIVTSTDDIKKIMTVGENNRTTASTKMNTNSSRSHLLLILLLKSYNSVSQMTTHGRLTLVDLAGSERISRSEATGLRLTEAAAINKSLSALGQVYGSIRDGALHIPFRNSKLTHLLQPCLGGNAKACMFVNVSPLETNHAETTSTLEFGTNARQVALGKATTNITKQ
jgi:kinesin family protein C2/C3